MALIYNFKKEEDNHIIEVSQISSYELYYTSDKSDTRVAYGELAVDTPLILATTKDGKYKLILLAEGETNVEILFNVIKYLQNGIIQDARILVCADCTETCGTVGTKCLSIIAKQCLNHKSIFVKLLSFQSLYIPTYGASYTLTFATFIEKAIEAYECKAQTNINNIIEEECITGSVVDVEKLFKLYLALYWVGMYFIEEDLAFGDTTELNFIKTKFDYETIISCLCNTCIDMENLREIYDDSNNIINVVSITSFQFDGTEYDINNVDLLTEEYLATNGTLEDTDLLEIGKEIAYTKLGRVGFVIKNTFPNKHNFLDVFGVNITEITFNKVYDETTLTETFVSKEYYTPSSVYYKLLKL